MENHGVLKPRRWSTVRKAQVIGAATGAILTAGLRVVLRASDFLGISRDLGIYLFWCDLLLTVPTDRILTLTGMTGLSERLALSLEILINSLILALIGSVIGLAVTRLKQEQH
jgi:hypothetical protein